MPSLSLALLEQQILEAFAVSGASAVPASARNQRPLRFAVSYAQGGFELWVYIWTLTHGGGRLRPTNEYRIQLTGIASPLALNPAGPTLLLGYEPGLACFAGFDIARHASFSTNSPSIQIPITVLHDAVRYGYAFTTKGNDEIAIGFRSDQFLSYCLNARLLHDQGTDAATVDLLQRAAMLEPLTTTAYEHIPLERRTIVSEVARLSRSSNFRRQVTAAYNNRCAVTRMQLNLIDAAHILPVGVSGSNDDVQNGICLSPTYHRAFDNALIYLDESLVMRLNPQKAARLESESLSGGLQLLQTHLNQRIHLPDDQALWPAPHFIRQANMVRKIPT